MTVGDLEARMSAPELDEWMLYYQLEPFGAWRADFSAALIAAAVHNVNRGKGQKAYLPKDFMPEFDAPPAPKPVNAVHAQLLAWFPPNPAKRRF